MKIETSDPQEHEVHLSMKRYEMRMKEFVKVSCNQNVFSSSLEEIYLNIHKEVTIFLHFYIFTLSMWPAFKDNIIK